MSRPSSGHILIIGGGIVGICTAYYLAQRGQQVTILEQASSAQSASAGNAGIVALGRPPLPRPGLARQAARWMVDDGSPLYIRPSLSPRLWNWFWNFHRACNEPHVVHCTEVLAAMGRETNRCWREIIRDESIACDFRPVGWLDVFRSEAGRRSVLEEAEFSARFGCEFETLSGDELRRDEPLFRPEVRGAVRYPESFSLDPAEFLTRLIQRLARFPVAVRQETAVARLLVRNNCCHGVELVSGELLTADAVVVAAGAWTTALARSVGVHIPLQAGKGYHLDLVAPEPPLTTACVCNESYLAVTPLGHNLRLAGTLEFSGINHVLRRRRLDMLLQAARKYLRNVDDRKVLSQWCGLRPCTADGLPVIGWAPGLRSLLFATGHAKMGLTHGPITGRLVSECILDGETSLDITPLRVDRF
ncbi:MAG: FAD-dependent oxidoreductase [bacterium]